MQQGGHALVLYLQQCHGMIVLRGCGVVRVLAWSVCWRVGPVSNKAMLRKEQPRVTAVCVLFSVSCKFMT